MAILSRPPKTLFEKRKEQQLWEMIHKAALYDEDLTEMLNKVKVYWYLKYGGEEYTNERN